MGLVLFVCFSFSNLLGAVHVTVDEQEFGGRRDNHAKSIAVALKYWLVGV